MKEHRIEISRRNRYFSATCQGIGLGVTGCTHPADLARKVRAAAAVAIQQGDRVRVVIVGSFDPVPVLEELSVLPNAPGTPLGYCNTTGLFFLAEGLTSTEPSIIEGIQFYWAYCPCCDRNGLTIGEPQFNPHRPQPHLFSRMTAEYRRLMAAA